MSINLLCAKCHKFINTIFEPCPNCGYQHPLTETGEKAKKIFRNEIITNFTSNTVAVLALYEDNSTVLIKRNSEPYSGYWCLPGGHINYGESIFGASIREMKEETGLDIKPIDYIPETYVQEGKYIYKGSNVTYKFYSTLVIAKIIDGEFKAQEDEVSLVDKFNLSDIPELAFNCNQMIYDYFNYYYGRKCLQCNSSSLICESKLNGWDYMNSIKILNICSCKECGNKFTREVVVVN